MALNIAKYAARLKDMEDGSKSSEFSKLKWSPKEGKQIIRIVPYKFDPANTIIELKFYYKIGGKNYLAPCTFGKPDPILEKVEQLRSSGILEDKELAKTIEPKTRFYAPIIVRGEEELGVRYWGFGVQVWKQLVKLVSSEDWGDITSFSDGNDLSIEFAKVGQKKNAKGESFPETTIIPCPKKTPAVDPSRRDLMEKLKDQRNILDIFPLKSYDELKQAFNDWLYPETAVDINPDQAELDSAAERAAAPAAAAPTASPSVKPTSTAETADDFVKFFNT